MKELLKKHKVRNGVIAFHILMTFLWANRVLKNIGEIAIGSKAVREVISRNVENIMAYIFSEFFAILLICLFWKLVFYVISHFRKSHIVFLTLFFAGAILLLLSWPAVFVRSNDNLITYSSAVRLTPDYWHSAYSSFIYAGCLLFFPADFMITIIQWAFFVFMLAYFYYRTENVAPKLKYLVFAFFLLPDTLLVIMDSYRICQYTIVVLIYAGLIMFDVIEKRERKTWEHIAIAMLGAFLAVWRNEGIIFCSAFFLMYVICTGSRSLWKKAQRMILYAALFGIILLPQKIGEIKYYGKDYQIINSLHTLQTLLNDPETNLDYDRAKEDLSAIETVLPVDIIKEYGLDGYRRYNYNFKGNMDINQSSFRKEESSAYLSAYASILFHNPQSIVKLEWDNLLYTLSAKHVFFPLVYVAPEAHVPLRDWGSEMWDRSSIDFVYNGHTAFLSTVTEKLGIGEKLIDFHSKISAWFFAKKGYLVFFFMISFFHCWMVMRGLIKLVRKKDLTAFGFGLVCLSMLLEYMALFMVMPAKAHVYLIISNYLSLAIGYCVLVSKWVKK